MPGNAAPAAIEAAPVTHGPVLIEPASNGPEWDAYVARHPHGTVDHQWGWRQVLRTALGHESVYVAARRDGRLVGVLPLVFVRSLLFGRSVVSMPFLNYGGALADDPDVAEALLDEARAQAARFGASHVELRHASRQYPSLPCRQHKLGMTMPLPAAAETLWDGLDRKVRNQVRKAQKAGLVCVDGGPELVDEFYGVFARNMRDLGTPVYSRKLFVETLRAFPAQARVFVVRHEQRAVAAGISLVSSHGALNPWASSLREARPLCANMLLYWRMLEDAIAHGAPLFDFGRSSPDGGTYQFKVQWGAQPMPLCWEYLLLSRPAPPDQSPSNPKFEIAIAAWKRLPLGVATAIGPVVARHLP